MASENMITLVGNLTREPELRYTTGGRGVTSFGLAVNRRYQQNSEWVEETSFFDVTAWGTLGENVAASLHKGTRAIVAGRLTQRSWDTDDGKRSKVEVIADSIGPDLRWASAEVERVARDKPRHDDGYEQTASQHSSQGGGGSGGNTRPPTYTDEEPFVRDAQPWDV
jgi:single-strand DNA-binding protein